MTDHVDGWHFAGDTLRDGSPLPRKGDKLPTIDNPMPCVRGYHASPTALQALQYAPGPRVARVRLSGVVVPHGEPLDKWAASEREMLTEYVDVSAVLRAFACRCALDVAHLWDMPAVVREYLDSEGRREDVRDAEWDAEWDAARAAEWAAKWAAKWAAARDAQSARLESMLLEAL